MSHTYTKENPLAQNFNIKSLLKFAFPTILTMIFMGLYTMIDTAFVSRFVDTNALSALNIVCPIINLIVGFGTMIATGGSAVIARKMGAKEYTRASQDFTLIIIAGALSGILISIFGSIFIDNMIWALGANSILFPYCKEYLSILLLFTPASILQVLFQNLIVKCSLFFFEKNNSIPIIVGIIYPIPVPNAAPDIPICKNTIKI